MPVSRSVEPPPGRAQSGSRTEDGWHAIGGKLLLTLGYLCLTAGLLAAHAKAPQGYEVSIYRSTPTAFWVGVAVALVASIVVGLYAVDGLQYRLSIVLGGLSGVGILGLPVIRNYFFFGWSDPMTHFLHADEIAAGELPAFALVYPANYSFAIFLDNVLVDDLERSMMLVVFLTSILLLVTVPLLLRRLGSGRVAAFVGLYSALLLLPVNTLSTRLVFFPFSMALFLMPLFVFVLFRYMRTGGDETGWGALIRSVTTPSFVVTILAGIGILLYHPQAATDILAMVAAIGAVQLWYRTRTPAHPIAGHRPVYLVAVVLTAAFVVWASQHTAFFSHLDSIVREFSEFLRGQETAAEKARSRTESADRIGVPVYELFAKMFLVSTVYILLSAGETIERVLGDVRPVLIRDPRRRWIPVGIDFDPKAMPASTYLFAAGLALVPVAGLYTIGNVSGYLFRHLGVGMLIATILGALFLARRVDWLRRVNRSSVRSLAVGAFSVVVVLALLTAYPSPYIYQQNQQVAEQNIDGLRTTFDVQDGTVPIKTLGYIGRVNEMVEWGYYRDLETAEKRFTNRILLTNFTTHIRGDYYLAVTRTAEQSELVASDGLQFSRAGFRAVETEPGVHRVLSNGDYRLYYVTDQSDRSSNELDASGPRARRAEGPKSATGVAPRAGSDPPSDPRPAPSIR